MTEECWKTIVGYPRHEISNLGRVRSWAVRGPNTSLRRKEPALLSGWRDRDGYVHVNLGQGYERVHQLLLRTLVREPQPGEIARHLNDVPDDNRLDNLVWGTTRLNKLDSIRNGGAVRGERHGHSRLTEEMIRTIRNSTEDGKTVGKRFGVSNVTISLIRRRLAWKHVL